MNRILAALPADERERLEPALRRFAHRPRDPVYRQGERIDAVVFPLSGVFSLVSELERRPPVEIATVGSEGFVGLPVFLQASLTGAHMCFSQVPGEALRMDAVAFLDAVNAAPALRQLLQRYAMALMTQIARGAACNRSHGARQRASRWLLQTHDRVGADSFTLPAQFLAQMLGEAPQSAQLALAALESAGAIASLDSTITVLDRATLERLSCDCYLVVREEYDRLLGDVRPATHHRVTGDSAG
jgi:CRP-like cAMP-binding protein